MPAQSINVPSIVEKLIANECPEPISRDQAEPPKRPFRALTQVSRQIRREFLPLYTARTTYRILHADIPEFLETVLEVQCLWGSEFLNPDPLVDCIDMQKYDKAFRQYKDARQQEMTRDLIIDCASLKCRNWKPISIAQAAPVVDILPFLEFIAAAPNVRVRCGLSACFCCYNDWKGMKGNIDALFDVSNRPKLAAWLFRDVERVELGFPPRVVFVMEDGCYTDWMRIWSRVVIDDPDMKSWMEDVGFEMSWDQHGSLDFKEHKN